MARSLCVPFSHCQNMAFTSSIKGSNLKSFEQSDLILHISEGYGMVIWRSREAIWKALAIVQVRDDNR